MSATRVLQPETVNLDVGLLLEQAGTRQRSHPAFQSTATWAIEQAERLAQPAGAYRWLSSHGVQESHLQLEGGVTLLVGPKASLLAPAREVLISVATIGPHLEAAVTACFDRGQILEGYLLDCAGVLALSIVRDRFRRLAEDEASRRGWGVSLATAPGSLVGWPIQGQKALAALLDLERIGVEVTPSSILSPGKSGSGLIGIGPEYTDHRVHSSCRYCRLQATCWRSERQIEPAI